MKLSDLSLDSRQSFNDTWLCEMPMGTGSFDTYDTLKYSISDFINHGIIPFQISENFFKIEAGNVAFFWYAFENTIILATELHKKAEGYVVSITGKNPISKGSSPFASQLYSDILLHTNKSIRILSDTQLSDEGFSIWKKMLKLGHKISIFDRTEPGKTFSSIETMQDLENYFKVGDPSFMNYQFVLSENLLDYCEVRASFRLRQHREKSNLSLV